MMVNTWIQIVFAASLCATSTLAVPAERKPGSDEFFSLCSECHSMTCNRNAPKLGGVIGRKAGSLPDYDGYSKAMLGVDVIWTSETLAAFLRDPEALVRGTRMESYGKNYLRAPEEELQKVLQFIQDPDNSSEICSTK